MWPSRGPWGWRPSGWSDPGICAPSWRRCSPQAALRWWMSPSIGQSNPNGKEEHDNAEDCALAGRAAHRRRRVLERAVQDAADACVDGLAIRLLLIIAGLL